MGTRRVSASEEAKQEDTGAFGRVLFLSVEADEGSAPQEVIAPLHGGSLAGLHSHTQRPALQSLVWGSHLSFPRVGESSRTTRGVTSTAQDFTWGCAVGPLRVWRTFHVSTDAAPPLIPISQPVWLESHGALSRSVGAGLEGV